MENPDLAGLMTCAREISDFLLSCRKVTVIGHIDADGITATSIAYKALQEEGAQVSFRFVKKIDDAEAKRISATPTDGLLLVDLGSGYLSHLEHPGLCVADHHGIDPRAADGQARVKGQSNLDDFNGNGGRHLNPHLFGFDGSRELSGAGAAYFIAKAMNARNRELSHLAIVGAVGDFQDSAECKLVGLNRLILDDAENAGMVRTTTDLRFFGRETRPLVSYLRYATDPNLPGLTNDQDMCLEFLRNLGIELKGNGGWRCWADLGPAEKKTIVDRLREVLHRTGQEEASSRLVGEVYSLPMEEERTVLHDAKEYATLLNSCGRYDKAPTGLEVCIKGPQLKKEKANAIRNLQNHRDNLKEAIGMVKGKERITLRAVQFLRNEPDDYCLPMEDTIVGIVAGMLLGSGEIPTDRPLLAFATSVDEANIEMTKVSARGTKELVDRGLDLSAAMRDASASVGGSGGGHNIAAGAVIPPGTESNFLLALDNIVGDQLHL